MGELNFLSDVNVYVLGLMAGIFTWAMTAFGASLVFLFRNIKPKILDAMLGFAAGVMIAASFFSLIIPALDYAEKYNEIHPVAIITFGFLLGVFFLMILDKLIPHLHIFEDVKEGPQSKLRRTTLMVLAITIHNIPEGLAVGVAFGAYGVTGNIVFLGSAVALALGIGLQNFPEGSAVSIPLYREGFSRKKSFFYGQLSAVVEPISILIGIYLVTIMQNVLALALAFAAGAMMFIVVEELIPESQTVKENKDIVTLFTMLGLTIMMILDVTLG